MQISQLSTLFYWDNDWLPCLASYWRCSLGDKLQKCIWRCKPQEGTPGQAKSFCRSLSFWSHVTVNVSYSDTFTALSLSSTSAVCGTAHVYWLAVFCVAFFFVFSLRLLFAPTEQLVLTTIRQEASELQDQGATMRVHLTHRFDKSEFAQTRLDDAPFLSTAPKRCMSQPIAKEWGGLQNPWPSRATISGLQQKRWIQTVGVISSSLGSGVMNAAQDFTSSLHVPEGSRNYKHQTRLVEDW